MARGKAHYNAPPTFAELLSSNEEPKPFDFSDTLRQRLRSFYPDKDAEADPVWGHPADAFVNHLLSEVRWAVSELQEIKLFLTKQDLYAERDDLLKTLTEAQEKLRRISPHLDRLLSPTINPLNLASAIDPMIVALRAADQAITPLPRKPRFNEMQHEIAVEMAIRVLSVAKGYYGMSVSATCDDYGHTSSAVQILKTIGDGIGLCLEEDTWRHILSEVKQMTPSLR